MQSSLECGVAVEHLNLCFVATSAPSPHSPCVPMTSFMGPRPSLLLPVFVHYCQLMQAKNKCQLTLLSLLFQHKLLVWMVL